MAKKKQKPQQTSTPKEAPFQVNAFSVLQNLVKVEANTNTPKKPDVKAAPIKAPVPQNEPSIYDVELLTQEEETSLFVQSFEQSQSIDLFQAKFHDAPRPQTPQKDTKLELSPQELEFAIFTGEMARSGVKRIGKEKNNTPPKKPKQGPVQNPKPAPQKINPTPQNTPTASAQELPQPAPETQITPKTSESPSPPATPTPAHRPHHDKFVKALKSYEQRFGEVASLRLRDYALDAAVQRIDDFIAALCENNAKYGQIVFQGETWPTPTSDWRRTILDTLQNDARILEWCETKRAETYYVRFKS